MDTIVTAALLFLVYILPSLIAAGRRHHSGGAILATNLLLGWTALGWLFALIWSLTGVQTRPCPGCGEPIPMDETRCTRCASEATTAAGGPLCPGCGKERTGHDRCPYCGAVYAEAEAALKPPPDIRACPHCAEDIKAAAKLCKHCGREVEPAALAPAG